jgi:hypothetical protein
MSIGIGTSSMLRALLEYVGSNDRVCPQSQRWNEMWQMLPDRKQVGVSWEPPPPLILAVWWESSVLDKRLRLHEHIHYAEAHGVLASVDKFLRTLPESEWAHLGEA